MSGSMELLLPAAGGTVELKTDTELELLKIGLTVELAEP